MRRLLLLGMVGMVAGALVVAGAGTYLLAGRGVKAADQTDVLHQAHQVAAEVPLLLEVKARAVRRGVVNVLRETAGLHFATVGPGGEVRANLPDGIGAADLRPDRLLAGGTVAGTVGSFVYAAVPVPSVSSTHIARIVTRRLLVVVLVQRSTRAHVGLAYLLVVSGGVLVVAAVVAVLVSRRITRPLVDAVATTQRIAGGDLEARVPDEPGRTPELGTLTASINTMASSLERSQALQRQFLLSISHDLRTPLTSILGYAEAIGDGTAPDPPAAAGVIASEARRLTRLVADLLDLARLESRQFSLRPMHVDVAEVVRAAAEGFRPAAADAGLTLHVVVPPAGTLWAVCDPDRLSQVVANLTENAYKYAAGQVQVACGADATHVSVVVDDDGPGIDPGEQVRVFERHYQAPSRAAARQAGTGLGLAIVAELVEAMGGTTVVHSPTSPGGGTRVEVRLPAA